MLSIQIDTKSLELVIYHQFNNIKLSFFASHMKSSFPFCTFNRCCTVIRYSRVIGQKVILMPDFEPTPQNLENSTRVKKHLRKFKQVCVDCVERNFHEATAILRSSSLLLCCVLHAPLCSLQVELLLLFGKFLLPA